MTRLLIAFSILLSVPTSTLSGSSAPAPEAVSPTADSGVAVVEARCPMFSWSTVSEASAVELVVYGISSDGELGAIVLQRSLPRGAHSWTPSLGRCLEHGSTYAWSVRASGDDGGSEWSAPQLFRIAPDRTAELLSALEPFLREGASVGDLLAAVQGSRERVARSPEDLERPPIDPPPAPSPNREAGAHGAVSQPVTSGEAFGLSAKSTTFGAAARGEFENSATADGAIGYLAAAGDPSGPGIFDGRPELKIAASTASGVLGFGYGPGEVGVGVLGIGAENGRAGIFRYVDSNGGAVQSVELGWPSYALLVTGNSLLWGKSLFLGTLQIPVKVTNYSSSADTIPEAYKITDPSAPACLRGQIQVMNPNAAGGGKDSLCFCGEVDVGLLEWWCFNP